MSYMLMELTSLSGTLAVFDNRLEIIRTNKKSVGDKTIFLNQISGIVLKESSFLSPGYINFTVPGTNSNSLSRAGIFNAALDENTFVFHKKDTGLAIEIKLKIEDLIKNQSKSDGHKSNDPDILRKYKQLFDDGIITQEEFEAKKKEILGI